MEIVAINILRFAQNFYLLFHWGYGFTTYEIAIFFIACLHIF